MVAGLGTNVGRLHLVQGGQGVHLVQVGEGGVMHHHPGLRREVGVMDGGRGWGRLMVGGGEVGGTWGWLGWAVHWTMGLGEEVGGTGGR